jgi:hypothetical protein
MGTYTTDETDSEIYVWSIVPSSAGSIQTGQNGNAITVLWNQQPQTATVQLAMRKCGQDFNGTIDVEIQDTPVATIALLTNPVCSGSDTEFSLSLSPNIPFSTSTWDFGDNSPLQTFIAGQQILHTYNDPLLDNTNYDVSVTVNGISSCQFSVTDFLQIVVSPSPIISVVPNRDYNLQWENIPVTDMNYTVVLQNGFSATDVIQWYHNDVPVGTTATINAFYLGEYYATVTNQYGCVATTETYTTTDSNSPGGSSGSGGPGSGSTCPTDPGITTTVTSTGCQEITINITNPAVTGTVFEWSNIFGSNANIIAITNTTFQANNILPGKYFVPVWATYPAASGLCPARYFVEVTVPYIADLKYNMVCNDATDDYTIELLDYSQYFVDTPIETFQFTVDGGSNWVNGTLNADGINSAIFQLQPGTTASIGIRIGRTGFTPCEAFKTLTIPSMPNADFVVPSGTCLDTPMQFIAPNNPDPNVTYEWDFNGEATNTQPNPVKTFTTANNNYQITLTVTNQFGCQDIVTKQVQVFGEKFDGFLESNLLNACEGDNMLITYNLFNPLGTLPEFYDWYKDELTTIPFATTSSQNNQISVTESGQYFVYVKDGNQCTTYTTPATSAVFIPIPNQPVLTGTETICLGNSSSVKAPVNPSINYVWSLNGITQPQWNGMPTVGMIHNQLGTYTYQVVAQVESTTGNFCISAAATFVVTVVEQPLEPQLDFDLISCSPYIVKVFVTNPQSGINYTWSNGGTGTSTDMFHDGPISVKAYSSVCEVSNQIDLPLDLFRHTWYYPAGCYSFCRVDGEKSLNYIIGPLVEFYKWEWLVNFQNIQSSNGQVTALENLETNTYQLMLDTGYCNTLLSNIEIEVNACENCELDLEVLSIDIVDDNGQIAYLLDVNFMNNFGGDMLVNLNSLGNEGYFVPNAVQLTPGPNSLQIVFYPLNGYNGGPTSIAINGSTEEFICATVLKIELPTNRTQIKGDKIVTDSQDQMPYTIILLAAPNPTNDTTTVYYNYGTTTEEVKRIEIIDMYGRTLHAIKANESKGAIPIDCNSYEAGQYFIVMKQNNQIIKTTKLIIK